MENIRNADSDHSSSAVWNTRTAPAAVASSCAIARECKQTTVVFFTFLPTPTLSINRTLFSCWTCARGYQSNFRLRSFVVVLTLTHTHKYIVRFSDRLWLKSYNNTYYIFLVGNRFFARNMWWCVLISIPFLIVYSFNNLLYIVSIPPLIRTTYTYTYVCSDGYPFQPMFSFIDVDD